LENFELDFKGQSSLLLIGKNGVGKISVRQALEKLGKSYESIGRKLADECRDGVDDTWKDPLLQHNVTELQRLRENVRPLLFPDDI
jgi:predicted ATPase